MRTLMHPQTRLAQAGQRVDTGFNSIATPLFQTATFRFEDVGTTKGYDYTRSGNPTRAALEDTLADLEGGAGAVALTTGMAAVSTVLSLLDAGDRVVCSHDCYGGTERLLTHLETQGKLRVTFLDLTRPHELPLDTRLIWIETPSNPLLRIVDIGAVARAAHDVGALVAVDNTFLTPLFQRPIELGADLVAYSTTKYLNGHSDVVGGAVVAATGDIHERVRFASNAHGTVAQPFDCWLVLRGLKTLPLRLKQHEENAFEVARFLSDHPAVERVYYPGLACHPGHELAARQQQGYGGMVSFEVAGGPDSVAGILRSTRVFALAESLGGVESLIEHPATMSHASMRPEARRQAGITDEVVRLSVGIENAEDLVADLAFALESVLVDG